MTKDPRIEIVHRGARAWLVRVFGTNGEQLSVSEVLTSRAAAFTNLYSQASAWSLLSNREIRTQFRDERTSRPTRKRRSKKQ